ncbi:adenylyl-sulfate kinase [Candidatus Woesearchaeota archaeon]|nr:MAG: adenylyl-sulfate kinase [Candidatus Woesearchaeota archaeon]
MNENIKWHEHSISLNDRRKLLGFSNKVLWFTGLSGSGKSTIANEVAKNLHDKKILTFVLDGDNVRHGLNSDMGFSSKDREENIRRVAEVTKLLYESGVTVLVCFISPFRKDRDFARSLIGDDFIEVFVDCSLEECEKRDPKGLYKKARKGEIKDFTGIDQEYEKPNSPEITINTGKESIEECAEKITQILS